MLSLRHWDAGGFGHTRGDECSGYAVHVSVARAQRKKPGATERRRRGVHRFFCFLFFVDCLVGTVQRSNYMVGILLLLGVYDNE